MGRWQHCFLLLISACVACGYVGGCDSEAGQHAPASPSMTPKSVRATGGSASAGADSSTGATNRAPAHVGTWRGHYKARKHTVALPHGESGKRWAKDDGSVAVGEGTIELTIERNNLIVGTVKGPLGQLHLRGLLDETTLRAGLTAADPTSTVTMTGIFVGDLAPDQISGQLRVSNHDGSLVRSADAQLRRY